VLANAFSIFLNYLVILVVYTRTVLSTESISSINSRQKLIASTAAPASSNQFSLAA